jgi:hypothetical protein
VCVGLVFYKLLMSWMFGCTGPLKFNITDYTGGLPTLIYEPNTDKGTHFLV